MDSIVASHVDTMSSDNASQQDAEVNSFDDPAERRVFHAALDSFR